jgi:RNA polymerase sigma-70 factor (ECF subfamily)
MWRGCLPSPFRQIFIVLLDAQSVYHFLMAPKLKEILTAPVANPSHPKKDFSALSDEALVEELQLELKKVKVERVTEDFSNPEVDPYFVEIYKRYQKKIEYYCARFIYDRDVLSDVFHDIFIKVYLNIHRFHYQKSFKAWVYKIAHNNCINYVRRSRKQDLTLLNRKVALNDTQFKEFIELCESGEIDIETKIIREELRTAIEEAVAKLPYQTINVYMLKTVAQLTFDEIAKIEKVSSRSVKTIYHNALFFIKQYLDEKNLEPGDLTAL